MIRLEGICKSFGQLQVLRDVSLEVARGEVVVVIGPSGSGKSTLLRVMNYLEPYERGMIYLENQPIYQRYDAHGHVQRDPERVIRDIRARIGMVSQRFNLFPHMNVLQNISTGPINVRGQGKAEAEARARELLQQVGLSEKVTAFPGQLSGGQQQRVAIARALVNNPKIVFADEPTGNLDSHTGEAILTLFRKLSEEGRTIVLVTHDPEIAARTPRRIEIRDGKVAKQLDAKLAGLDRMPAGAGA